MLLLPLLLRQTNSVKQLHLAAVYVHGLLVVRLVGQSVFLDIQPPQRLSCQRLHQQRFHRRCWNNLVTTLVSSVTAAVTQQLLALLPSPSTAFPGISPPSSSTYRTVESSSSAHATALVQGALGEAHSNISGQARPFTIPEQLLPNQPFNSASLPLDARVPDKIKEKYGGKSLLILAFY